jgi:hypothetical protein
MTMSSAVPSNPLLIFSPEAKDFVCFESPLTISIYYLKTNYRNMCHLNEAGDFYIIFYTLSFFHFHFPSVFAVVNSKVVRTLHIVVRKNLEILVVFFAYYMYDTSLFQLCIPVQYRTHKSYYGEDTNFSS